MTTQSGVSDILERLEEIRSEYRETTNDLKERLSRLEDGIDEVLDEVESDSDEREEEESEDTSAELSEVSDDVEDESDGDSEERTGDHKKKEDDDEDEDMDEEKNESEDSDSRHTKSNSLSSRSDSRRSPAPKKSDRAENRRLSRENNKRQRQGDYGKRDLPKEPGMGNTLHRGEHFVGNLIRAALRGQGNSLKDPIGHSGLSYLEERGIAWSQDSIIIPFELMAETLGRGEKFEQRAANFESKRIQAGYVHEQFDYIAPDGQVRVINVSGGGGAVGVQLDVARSQMWLAEASPVLGYMNPIMGVNSEYQIWYGNVAPTGGEVGEGLGWTENSPTLTKKLITPTDFHLPWSITDRLASMDAVGLEGLVVDGAENQLMPRIVKAILSGPNTGASFANNSLSFNGLMGSGINVTNFGANSDTAITSFDRSTVINAETQLRVNNAMGSGPFWILSTAMAGYACDKRIGGTEAIVYLAQRTGFREGYIGGSAAATPGTPFVETNQLGRTNNTAFKRTAIGVLGLGSQMVPVFFGQGLELRIHKPTTATKTEYSLHMPVGFVMVNPKNAEAIGQA